MKRVVLFIVFLLFFSHSYADGISNEYGKFIVDKTAIDYAVSFILNPANEKFPKIKKIMMIDYDNDGEGDVSVLLYRTGGKEVFFRTEENYKRYVLKNASADVCEDAWSPKIVYRENRHTWKCSKMNFLAKFFMWREIDSGLLDAKAGDFNALAKRIIKNVEKIKK